MTTFTSRGVPMVEGTDPADIAARVNPVAQLHHDRPGVSALTTTQRNALTGAELWDGRLILNTTTDRINRYDLGTTTWVAVADSSEVAALLATSGTPAQDGLTASRGVSAFAARADHVHPEPAWQTYAPVLSSWGVGAGSILGRYVQHGKTIHYRILAVLGAGYSAPAAGMTFTLPVAMKEITANPNGKAQSLAQAVLTDVGSQNYAALALPGLTTVSVYVNGVNGGAVVPSATVPFSWVVGDFIEVFGTYEAA